MNKAYFYEQERAESTGSDTGQNKNGYAVQELTCLGRCFYVKPYTFEIKAQKPDVKMIIIAFEGIWIHKI